MKSPTITQDQIIDLLDKCYPAAMNGIPSSKSCEALASEYMDRYTDPRTAAEKFIDKQILKCTTSGFLSGLGGLVTLPVTIPANIASVIYVQMRMIGTLAVMGGYNLNDDEVQTLVYLCLAKASVTDAFKAAGVQTANKMTINLIQKVPGSVLTTINQKIGFRFITKFGETGIINLGKLVPVAGGIVNGGADLIETRIIAKKAYKVFLLNNLE